MTAAPDFVHSHINLASAGLGAKGLYATDEFFAPLARMIADSEAVFVEDKYDDHGKWMDGWESRRRRDGGHDYAVIKLAAKGVIYGFDVDTSHFTGNYPPACRIEACVSDADPDEETSWQQVLPTSSLGASAHHYFCCDKQDAFTHVRLHIYPDGGVARLRVYGQPVLDLASGAEIDLASSLNGARIVSFSDAHYGDYRRMLAPGRGLDMGDGWETRRRRTPGNDWIVIALATRGHIARAVVETTHYKGNFPVACSIDAADLSELDATGSELDKLVTTSSMFWDNLLPKQPLSADGAHEFTIDAKQPITHIRLNIYPDGGISRLRLFGNTS